MRFREYLTQERIQVTEVAEKLKVHINHVFMILNGKRRPSIHLARKIEEMTNKQVTIDELIPRRDKPEVCPCCGRKMDSV